MSAKAMDRPTRELFDTGILGSGVDRGLQGRRYESFVRRQEQDETPDMPQVRRQQAQAGWRSKARSCPLLWSKINRRAAKTRVLARAPSRVRPRNLSRPKTP